MAAHRSRAWLAGVVGLTTLLTATGAARAAVTPPPAITAVAAVAAVATPSTVQAGSPLHVTGSVSPVASGAPVTLLRRINGSFVPVATQLPSAGTFDFTVLTPWVQEIWDLRLRSGTTVSADLWVRVTKAHYSVTASAVAPAHVGDPLLVKGSVAPLATGWVALQRQVGSTWQFVVSAQLARDSSYVLTTHLPAGPYKLRVVKPAALTIAIGISPAISVTVGATSPPPTQTTLSFGTNYWGQLGDGVPEVQRSPTVVPGLTSVKAVAVGDRVDYALRTDGTVWAWGEGRNGQLGNGHKTAATFPVRIGTLAHIVAIAAWGSSALALDSAGAVWTWGSSLYYLPGTLHGVPVVIPPDNLSPVQVAGVSGATAIAVGSFTGYALMADGTVWSWGSGAGGGPSGEKGEYYEAAPVAGVTGATAVAAADDTVYVLRNNGTVLAWGEGYFGQLGNGQSGYEASSGAPVQVLGLAGVTAIAAGFQDGYARKADGTLWAWGADEYGQLGSDRSADSAVPVQVAAGSSNSTLAAGSDGLALRTDGTVVAWGPNDLGALGDGTTVDRAVPVPVPTAGHVVALAAGVAAGLGRSRSPLYEPVGITTALAVLANGTVLTWGLNPLALLDHPAAVPVAGLHDVRSVVEDGKASFALDGSGSVWAWGSDVDSNVGSWSPVSTTPTPVPGLTHILSVAARNGDRWVVKDDGTVWTWRTGNPTPSKVAGLSGIVSVAAFGTGLYANDSGLLALSSSGLIWGIGDNTYGMLGPNHSGHSGTPVLLPITGASAISSGPETGYALKSDGTVWAWGDGAGGVLGDGVDRPYGTAVPTPVRVSGLTGVTQITPGFALRSNGSIAAWGGDLLGGATHLSPVTLAGIPASTVIASNDQTFYALAADGTEWSVGYNWNGETGIGDLDFPYYGGPSRVVGVSHAVAIAAVGHSAFVTVAS